MQNKSQNLILTLLDTLSICFLTFFIAYFSNSYAIEELKETAQDLIIETKRIKIPGYPTAFNPSVIRWKGSLLLSFREIPYPPLPFNSRLGLVWLDEDFNPKSPPQILETQSKYPFVPSRVDDARLVIVGDRLYLVYSDNQDTIISRGGFRLYVAEVLLTEGIFSLHNTERLSIFEEESKQVRQKNWVPFDYQGNLLLAYSLQPHVIFHPLLMETETCETVVSTISKLDWNWGELRGGTPAILENGEYLSFFHSGVNIQSIYSNGKVILHYFTGAYTFQKDPPFAITKISPQPIIEKGFYSPPHYKPYWKSVRVVFPCGILCEEEYIWVTYGRQDHESWVAKFDKKKLLSSLVDVKSIETICPFDESSLNFEIKTKEF